MLEGLWILTGLQKCRNSCRLLRIQVIEKLLWYLLIYDNYLQADSYLQGVKCAGYFAWLLATSSTLEIPWLAQHCQEWQEDALSFTKSRGQWWTGELGQSAGVQVRPQSGPKPAELALLIAFWDFTEGFFLIYGHLNKANQVIQRRAKLEALSNYLVLAGCLRKVIWFALLLWIAHFAVKETRVQLGIFHSWIQSLSSCFVPLCVWML